MKNLFRLVFCILFLPSLYALDANIRFEHLTLDQGLSQNSVLCILQDRRGFLWFGTEDGLNKYDGYKFTVYRYNPQDSNSLSDNHIMSLCKDDSGSLWIGTKDGGLNRFNPKTGKFNHWRHDAQDSASLSSNHILSVFIDNSGDVWCATYGSGLSKFDGKSKKFINWKNNTAHPTSLSNNYIYDIFEDHSGNMWFATYNGLSCLKAENKINGLFSSYFHDAKKASGISHNRIWTIYESSYNGDTLLWVGTQSGLNYYDPHSDSFYRFYPEPANPASQKNSVNSIIQQKNTLWIGTFKGLFRLDLNHIKEKMLARKKINYESFFQNPNNRYSLNENFISSLFLDISGTLWIGTFGGGINKYASGNQKFKLWVSELNNPASLSNSGIRSICETDDGLLWIGTNNGLNLFNRQTGKCRRFVHNANDRQSIAADYIASLYKSNDGGLWLGSYGGGLSKMYRDQNGRIRFKQWDSSSGQFIHNYIQALYQDTTGVLWMGTWGGGLYSLNPATSEIHNWVPDSENPFSISHNDVWCIYEDKRGNLWIGTYGGGLNLFDRERNRFYNWRYKVGNPNSLSHNTVYAIYQYSQETAQTLWIGTGGGLTRMEVAFSQEKDSLYPPKVRFTQYTMQHGLPNNVIYGILEDPHGNLWLSTNKGLSCFDPQRETFYNYDVHDGLQSNEFNAGAYFQSASGMMFFGGVSGLNGFYPDSLTKNSYIPPVVITDFQLFNKSVEIGASSPLKAPVTESEQIILNYRQNIFSFEFAALDYTAPQKNRFAYKMERFEQDWNYVDRRFASYTGLPAGEYTFRVIASNNDGLWNREGAKIKIVITPPPWKTWWAYLIYAIVFLFGLVVWRRLDLKKQRSKEEERLRREREAAELREAKLRARAAEFEAQVLQAQQEKEKQQIRNRIARDLHDEIGSNLSSIKLISEFMRSRDGLDEETRQYFNDIYRAARTSGEAIREIVWFINPESDRLDRLIGKMKETAAAMLKNIKVSFTIPQPLTRTELNPQIRRGVFLAFKEMLNNIIKHAQATEVEIKIKKSDEAIFLSVYDNGIGFEESSVDSGQGLNNMKHRVAEMNGSLSVKTAPGRGTRVILQVKIA